MQIIVTDPTLSAYTQRTKIDDREYVLTFTWNQRAEKWFLDVADQDSDPIVSGIALVCGVPLLRLVTDPRAPVGALILLDTTGADIDPGLTDLGGRVLLMYATLEEIAEIIA